MAESQTDERALADFENSVQQLLELIGSVETLVGQGAELPEFRNTAESLCTQTADSARQLDVWFRRQKFVLQQRGCGAEPLRCLRDEISRKEELIRSTERQLRDTRLQLSELLEKRQHRRENETPKLQYSPH